VIDQRIDPLGEVVGSADFDVGAGGRFGGKVGGGFQVAQARFGQHFVGYQNVLASRNQVGFFEAQVGVAFGLVHLRLLWVGVEKTQL
jgi:hypothetical protein